MAPENRPSSSTTHVVQVTPYGPGEGAPRLTSAPCPVKSQTRLHLYAGPQHLQEECWIASLHLQHSAARRSAAAHRPHRKRTVQRAGSGRLRACSTVLNARVVFVTPDPCRCGISRLEPTERNCQFFSHERPRCRSEEPCDMSLFDPVQPQAFQERCYIYIYKYK